MAKKLTPKMLGLVDGVMLSTRYPHTPKVFRTVTDRVIGYYIAGDGHRGPIRIAPIYDATMWIRVGKARHTLCTHEVGDYMNPQRPFDEEPDRDGDALATIAATALAALSTHAVMEGQHRSLAKQVLVKKAKKIKRG